jgi:hypothetical protein
MTNSKLIMKRLCTLGWFNPFHIMKQSWRSNRLSQVKYWVELHLYRNLNWGQVLHSTWFEHYDYWLSWKTPKKINRVNINSNNSYNSFQLTYDYKIKEVNWIYNKIKNSNYDLSHNFLEKSIKKDISKVL